MISKRVQKHKLHLEPFECSTNGPRPSSEGLGAVLSSLIAQNHPTTGMLVNSRHVSVNILVSVKSDYRNSKKFTETFGTEMFR